MVSFILVDLKPRSQLFAKFLQTDYQSFGRYCIVDPYYDPQKY